MIKKIISKEEACSLAYILFLNLSITSLILFLLDSLTSLNILMILSQNWLFSIFVFSSLISFLSKYNLNLSKNKSSSFIESIFRIAPYFFLSILFILAINQFLKLDFITARNFYLTIFGIFFGFLAFYKNRNKVERELEKEKSKEETAEKKRFDEFEKKFPRLKWFDFSYGIGKARRDGNYLLCFLRILVSPLVWMGRLLYTVVRWMYREGWWYVGILILILIIFTAIKAPYFGVNFTGEHTMKYNTYVEPAKYMAESNNPFWNQATYQTAPVERPEGIWKTFGRPPIIEWGLLLTYKLLPFNSLEFNTRLFMNILGILTLFFCYIFLTKWLSKSQSLFIIFLIAINPLINFVFFTTVEDSLLLLFMFIYLIYFSIYLKTDKTSDLFFAGLFLGIGVASKYSILIWMFPIIFLLLFLKNKNLTYLIKCLGLIGILSFLPTLIFRTSLRYLPTNALLSIISFIVWIFILCILYKYITKNEEKINVILERLTKNKINIIVIILCFLVLSVFFALITKAYLNLGETITDSKLIFNYGLYDYMLNNQFKEYMTTEIFYLGLIGLLFSLFIDFKGKTFLLFPFFISSLFYWVLASKVIFFHNYYTHIIVITFCLSIGLVVYTIGKSLKNKFCFVLILFMILLIVSPTSYNSSKELIGNEKISGEYLNQAAQYLIENTNRTTMFIDDSYVLTLSILTGRPRIDESGLLVEKEIRESISETGFSQTMSKYNIAYVITTRNSPRYDRYVNLFTEEDLQSVSYRRTDIILSKLNPDYTYFQDLDRRRELIEEFRIRDKFILEKEIGPYKFFRFIN